MKKLLASLVGLSLLLSVTGCVLGPRDEKQAFIDATVEATCYVFKAENLRDPAVDAETKAIFKKYGFNAEDTVALEAIATKYAEDEEARTTIMTKIQECSKGVPGLENLQPPIDTIDTATTPSEEAAEGTAEKTVEGDKTTPAAEAAATGLYPDSADATATEATTDGEPMPIPTPPVKK